MTRTLALAWIAFSASTSASHVVAFSRSGNSVQFRLDDGFAEVLWMNHTAVRVRQAWRDQAPSRTAAQAEKIGIGVLDGETSVKLRSRDLTIVVSKRPFSLRFEEVGGDLLLEQAPMRAPNSGEVDYRFSLQNGERLFGLGHQATQLNRRGTAITTKRPLLISDAGYGLYFPGDRAFHFDLGAAKPSELRVTASSAVRGDYVFYYGDAPSRILEQHAEWFGEPLDPVRAHARVLPPLDKPSYAPVIEGAWPDVIRQIFQAGFSGIPVTAINPFRIPGFATPFGGDLLAAILPIVLLPADHTLSPEATALRDAFESHRLTYLAEARDRGLPCIHSMAYQFPFDPEAAAIEDQFFFGDEILVAPFLGPANHRRVYLPQGLWTNWETNSITKGRQTITVTTDRPAVPLWVRNGSIVPVDRRDFIEVHYFPKLGGESFLWEPESDQITQFHAAPAGDLLRLQIEAKVARTYEWVVHNVGRPAEVRLGDELFEEAPGPDAMRTSQWHYNDGRRNLHVRLSARAGDDLIVNVSFRSSPWALQ
jgi:hypothetical protein